MPVTEGESFTLHTNITERKNEDIQWLYKENTLIAELREDTVRYYDCDDGRFNNRLQLDNETGSLTIININKIHSGPYKLLITDGSHQTSQNFDVTVFGELKSSYL